MHFSLKLQSKGDLPVGTDPQKLHSPRAHVGTLDGTPGSPAPSEVDPLPSPSQHTGEQDVAAGPPAHTAAAAQGFWG